MTTINIDRVRRHDPALAEQVERHAQRRTKAGRIAISSATWRRLTGAPEPLPTDPATVERIKRQARTGGCCDPPARWPPTFSFHTLDGPKYEPAS